MFPFIGIVGKCLLSNSTTNRSRVEPPTRIILSISVTLILAAAIARSQIFIVSSSLGPINRFISARLKLKYIVLVTPISYWGVFNRAILACSQFERTMGINLAGIGSPVCSSYSLLIWSKIILSKSRPPQNISPSVANSVNWSPSHLKIVTSNVPPPKS